MEQLAPVDLVVRDGGITGAGIAPAAASRRPSTIFCANDDLAQATTQRSRQSHPR